MRAESEKYYLEALSLNEGNSLARINLGNLYIEMELYNKAIDQYKYILDFIDESHMWAAYNTAYVYGLLQNEGETLKYLALCIKNGFNKWKEIETTEEFYFLKGNETYEIILNSMKNK